MKNRSKDPRGIPAAIEALAVDAKAGKMDRREFLALASIFGASTAAAYGMIGLAAPSRALAETPKKGGVLKVGMFVKDQKDPRTYDWPEMANVTRQFLEPLVKYTREFTFKPMLLEKLGSERGRDRIYAARAQGRDLEQRRQVRRRRRHLQSQSLVRQGRPRAIRWRRAWPR